MAYRTDAGPKVVGRWCGPGACLKAEATALLDVYTNWERCSFIDVVRDEKGAFFGISFRALLRPEPDGTFSVSQDPGERRFDDFFESLDPGELDAMRAALADQP